MSTQTPQLGAFCHEVSKTYRIDRENVSALQHVGKGFPRGTLTVIAGPSGSGKSSLLRILACVDRPDAGSVEIASQSVANSGARERRRLRRYSIAFIFPGPIDNLIEYLTAAEQLRLAARLRGQRLGHQETTAMLSSLGLADRADHTPNRLSGGEQQRVAIACAMVAHPPFVIADEPTAELDSVAVDQVLDGFGVLCGSGAAIAIASHDPRVIERADHVLRLDRGRVTESW